VLVGQKAGRAERLLSELRPKVRIFKSPHPSPMFVNHAKGNRDRILAILCEAAACLDKRDSACNQ
jgi:uracil-DNA glycosylase